MKEKSELATAHAGLKSAFQGIENEKEELARNHQLMEQQVQTITADLSREKENVNVLRAEIEQINASKGDVGKQVNELKNQLASMTTKLKEVTDNYQQYQDDTSKQFETAEKAEKALVKKQFLILKHLHLMILPPLFSLMLIMMETRIYL